MTRDTIANLLIHGMPLAVALKTIAFLILWIILWRQPTDTPLGKWVNVFFLFTFLTSILVTDLTRYLTQQATAEDVTTIHDWVLIIGFNILPLLTAMAGTMVVIHTRREQETPKTLSTDNGAPP